MARLGVGFEDFDRELDFGFEPLEVILPLSGLDRWGLQAVNDRFEGLEEAGLL